MWLQFSFLILSIVIISGSELRFTNVECEVMDPSYVTYKQCNLKILGRGIVGLNIYAKLLKGPIYTALINLSLSRKFNGYRPFMFNTTFDYCKLRAKGNWKLSFEKIVTDGLLRDSNLNDTCPIKNDIIVNNLVLKEDLFTYLPLPTGEYKVQINCCTKKEWKTRINIYFSRKEDLIKN